MAKAAAEAVSSGDALAVGLLGPGLGATAIGAEKAGLVPEGQVGQAAKDIASFGGTAAQREQEARFQQGIEQLKNLETSSRTQGTTGTESTSQTTFGAKGAPQQELEQASLESFREQLGLVQAQEDAIAGRGGLQTSARQGLQGILGGGAFAPTASEQERIDQLAQASISRGSGAVNELLNQRLSDIEADAARRGVRGQAFSQLQTGALGEAAKSLERQTLAAEERAAGQAIDLPQARAGLQAQTAGQFATFQDAARQQAIQNRQLIQDPALLAQLQEERLKGGKTTQTGTTTTDQTTTQKGAGAAGLIQAQAQAPGQVGAGIAGFGQGVGIAADVAKLAGGGAG